jgi:hypothetical protein
MSDLLEGARFAGLLLAGGRLLLVLLVGPTAFISPAIWNGRRTSQYLLAVPGVLAIGAALRIGSPRLRRWASSGRQ